VLRYYLARLQRRTKYYKKLGNVAAFYSFVVALLEISISLVVSTKNRSRWSESRLKIIVFF
jgi:ABC-type lipoprotein release transport system permease subunit